MTNTLEKFDVIYDLDELKFGKIRVSQEDIPALILIIAQELRNIRQELEAK